MKEEKIPTGISKFDEMVKGGFEKESINLVAGGSGSGKTIFALQFLLEGVKRGEHVLYVTFEEKKEDFYRNMKKFGWDLEKVEGTGKFIFLEYSPEKVKMMLDEGGGPIETTVLKYEIKRLVIDSITSFSILFDDELSRRQSMLGLFDIIRKWNCTTLLTVQHDPSKKSKGISPIEFEADSITLLHFMNIQNKRERFIEILKMRGTDHSTEKVHFEIDKGIKIGKSIKASKIKKTSKKKRRKKKKAVKKKKPVKKKVKKKVKVSRSKVKKKTIKEKKKKAKVSKKRRKKKKAVKKKKPAKKKVKKKKPAKKKVKKKVKTRKKGKKTKKKKK